ncbi:MAG: pseudouridine-5'-phosphate glycosidase [Firmicutes bacterium]|nr:pseudouridine-5'-phosphate glycosidase [Bacillota bacterium]
MISLFKISEEVKNALLNHQGIVALESTIISHGMPYPQNVETALECEAIIRRQGVIPATIAIINGVITIGLSKEEIVLIGKNTQEVIKTSRRDIPYVVSMKKNGALTVSATMIACKLAGIRFFATGGIGGVHRNAEITMDISADLEELSQTDVCVISAGAKSILDLEKTLEYLETKGVPVIGYQTNILPAFYTRESDFFVNYRLDTPQEIANLVKTKWNLGLHGGVFIANPIPEEFSFPKQIIDDVIESALIEMNQLEIKGKDTTPFLLKKIASITKGKSLEANIKLVYNNCELAANIAKSYALMEEENEKN